MSQQAQLQRLQGPGDGKVGASYGLGVGVLSPCGEPDEQHSEAHPATTAHQTFSVLANGPSRHCPQEAFLDSLCHCQYPP